MLPSLVTWWKSHSQACSKVLMTHGYTNNFQSMFTCSRAAVETIISATLLVYMLSHAPTQMQPKHVNMKNANPSESKRKNFLVLGQLLQKLHLFHVWMLQAQKLSFEWSLSGKTFFGWDIHCQLHNKTCSNVMHYIRIMLRDHAFSVVSQV